MLILLLSETLTDEVLFNVSTLTQGGEPLNVLHSSSNNVMCFLIGCCSSFQLFVGDDTSMWLQAYVGASVINSFNLFTVSFHLYFYFLLILLSGDVELNPGPITGKNSQM